jgi:hypothetical protein
LFLAAFALFSRVQRFAVQQLQIAELIDARFHDSFMQQ